ncbi:hypothetical protein Ddye_032166 [Dipteronia dyeriana]|uniref:Myosin motor domain-containing protein n=1 Tax=Dipteronia dyeriana TaxID=168575 RepID=A0AAD9TJP2_9ROSI|nr:hypothetical protein Ddye_032166 [Dipteronia dyeriana]
MSGLSRQHSAITCSPEFKGHENKFSIITLLSVYRHRQEHQSIKKKSEKSIADIAFMYPKGTEAPPTGVDDMTKLAYLHEPGVLHNLACRFALNGIYTYTGNILIAVNPFRRLPHLYDIHMMEQYKEAAFGELSPHLFAVADTCYRAMIHEQGRQSILVSGESGAGKTEMLMRYLAFMGGRSSTEGRTVEHKVVIPFLQSNPVLEAFGNAKAVKNNTSQFGKFVEIQFDKHGKISGATSNCYEVANVDDAREYPETRKAMDIVGISQEEQVLTRPIHEKALEDSLCKSVIVTPDGNITKPLDPYSAALSRDALAKTVYSRLFDWIVEKINSSIGQDPNASSLIGVLDIYGFESFKINRYITHVFKMEQEEYTREEINWSYVAFVDNQDVLDLIEKQ